MPTHYERLGARPDDDRDAIWLAYLGAVRSALSSPRPEAELRALDDAWGVLGDPERRAAYDRSLARDAGDAADETPPPAGPPSPGNAPRRSGRSEGWDRARRQRRLPRRAVGWLVACVLAGAAAGLAFGLAGDRSDPFAVGSCVALTEAEAVAVDCAAPNAAGVVVEVAESSQDCPGGWIERGDERFACVELRESPDG